MVKKPTGKGRKNDSALNRRAFFAQGASAGVGAAMLSGTSAAVAQQITGAGTTWWRDWAPGRPFAISRQI